MCLVQTPAVGAAVGAAVGTASGATWLARPENLGTIEGVSIDSRAVTPGQVFVAIKGEKHDGHDYLAQAVSGGANLLIVSREMVAFEWLEQAGTELFREVSKGFIR